MGPALSVRLREVSVKRESTVLTMPYQMAETTEFVDEIRTCDHCEKIFSNFLGCNGVCNCVKKSVCKTSSSKTTRTALPPCFDRFEKRFHHLLSVLLTVLETTFQQSHEQCLSIYYSLPVLTFSLRRVFFLEAL